MAIDSQTEVLALKIFVGYIPLLLSESEVKQEPKPCYRDTNFADADFKPALLGSHLSA